MSKDSQRGPQASSAIGLTLVAAVVLFTFAGYGLDRWLDTGPWLMVAGVFVGFAVGLAYLVLIVRSEPPDTGSREDETGEGDGPGKGSS